MKVYFAGSIRGGREDAELYHRIIAHIQKNHTVLTEHVGNLNLQESAADRDIYTQDTAWLRECDIVIAECTCPSLGVGYELACAEQHNKPVHIFFRKDAALSAMLTGDPCFHLHPYEDESGIYSELDKALSETGEKLNVISFDEAVQSIPCGRYRHFKGREYEVLGIARHSETEAPLVVYRKCYDDGGLWVRPADVWNETVERDGKSMPRFARISDQ